MRRSHPRKQPSRWDGSPEPAPAPPPHGSAEPRHAPTRRGTVLLFALGVLAVIAVAALSYVTFVRLDRQSAAAVARHVGYERQVNLVRDHIGALLAADLSGGKLVTPDVPRANGDIQLWPRMFEDGEYRDFPWTDFSTFNDNRRPDDRIQNTDPDVLTLIRDAKGGARFELAPRDDAWLAATEPVWVAAGGGGRVTQAWWPQITNLRSAWRYDDNGTPRRYDDDRYVRGDGRYVDLAQFFLDYLRASGSAKNRANPGTNLLDWDLNLPNNGGVVFARDAAGDYARAPYEQINFMDVLLNDDSDLEPLVTLDKSDERHWVDTDGDLRPDARWQVLDELGNYNGLIWVVAARIIDASSMVNYHAAVDGGFDSIDTGAIGSGRTPADIDLTRLIRTANFDPFNRYSGIFPADSPYQNIAVDRFDDAFTSHLIDRLNTYEVFLELSSSPPGGLGLPVPSIFEGWTWGANRLNQAQRDALWKWVGSSPGHFRLDLGDRDVVSSGYSRADLVDLCAFRGSNQRSFLSGVEETFDAPYLPRNDDPENPGRTVGPLLAATVPSNSRYLGNSMTAMGGPSEGRPTATEMRWSTRDRITPVNGVGLASPVPVLNFDDRTRRGELRYANRFRNDKISLADFTRDDVPAAYEALVWALAPLATDETLTSGLYGTDGLLQINALSIGAQSTYHYGGGIDGPAVALPGFQLGQSGFEGASFALLTAAQIAVNLADATDQDDGDPIGNPVTPVPTVARLLPTQQENFLGAGIRDCAATPAIELGTAFSHGDVPPSLVAPAVVGDLVSNGSTLEDDCESGNVANWQIANANKGVTVVGLERHPYILEVFSAAAYTTVSGDARAGSPRVCNEWNGMIDDPYDPNYQVGGLLAFQLANPWHEDLSLAGYEIRLVKGTTIDPTDATEDQMLVFGFQSDDILPADTSQTYIFFYDSMAGAVSEPLIGEAEGASPGGGPAGKLTTILKGKGIAGRLVPDPDADPPSGILNAIDKVMEVRTDFDPVNKPVFFQDLADGDTRVLLVNTRATDVLRLDVSPPRPIGAVVDRLENVDATGKFPAVLEPGYSFAADGGLDKLGYFASTLGYTFFNCPAPPANPNEAVDRFDAGKINGRVIVTGSLTRPTERRGTGFPMYVMDFGDDANALTTHHAKHVHAWLETCPQVDPAIVLPNGLPTDDLLPQGIELDELLRLESNLGFDTRKPAADDTFPHAGPFNWQLFVPNDPLYAASDVGLICPYANLVYNNDVANLDAWRTVGQQLARSLYYDFSTTATDLTQVGAVANPYIGALDFSRFIPQGSAFPDGAPPDESLALPLAVRVFDCFEALDVWPDQSLVQGRMNVNTMSERVLETLPLLAPTTAIPGSNLGQTLERIKLIYQYRQQSHPDDGAGAFFTPTDVTGIGTVVPGPALRRSDKLVQRQFDPDYASGQSHVSGFATAGELAILDRWAGNGAVNIGDGFVAGLGLDGPNSDPPSDVYPWYTLPLPGAVPNDPADDAEERIALYRAVSNLVSSRSDVFIAWFVIRGYDPDTIEGIQDIRQQSEVQSMESTEPEFAPAYESRWLVVYDRSNVKRPTDRPRVLLQAELPSAKP